VDNRPVATEAGDPLRPPTESAELEIVRERGGWADRARSYRVLVDGEEAARIRRGQTKVVAIQPGSHEIQLTIDWARSPSIEVHVGAGQRVSLRCWPNVRPFGARRGLAQPADWIGLALDESASGP
jgi:hypothetical protein